MARIVRRERALIDLVELHSYLAVQSGESVADAFIYRIEQHLAQTAEFPYLGRLREELALVCAAS